MSDEELLTALIKASPEECDKLAAEEFGAAQASRLGSILGLAIAEIRSLDDRLLLVSRGVTLLSRACDGADDEEIRGALVATANIDNDLAIRTCDLCGRRTGVLGGPVEACLACAWEDDAQPADCAAARPPLPRPSLDADK